MLEWTKKKQYFRHPSVRCFGFNNPDPTPRSSKYGYETWLTIPKEVNTQDREIKPFSGGTYAVACCSGEEKDAGNFIPESGTVAGR
jgi:DNA gyrase inhibitor GyrI